MAHEEYLRRNLIVAKAAGANAGARAAIDRLGNQKRAPQWLIEVLLGIADRTDPLAAELAMWRDAAPDRPSQ